MAFKSMSSESFDDMVDNLPWANKWKQKNGTDEQARTVLGCQVYDSGIMVVTKEYKGYLHEGQEIYANLLEALEVWVSEGKRVPSLKVKCLKKGKLNLGTDDEEFCKCWYRTESRYVQIFDTPDNEAKPTKTGNPLLGGSGVQVEGGRRGGRPRSVAE